MMMVPTPFRSPRREVSVPSRIREEEEVLSDKDKDMAGGEVTTDLRCVTFLVFKLSPAKTKMDGQPTRTKTAMDTAESCCS